LVFSLIACPDLNSGFETVAASKLAEKRFESFDGEWSLGSLVDSEATSQFSGSTGLAVSLF
jgi:hypothetical protein